jgi:hypothetical protein
MSHELLDVKNSGQLEEELRERAGPLALSEVTTRSFVSKLENVWNKGLRVTRDDVEHGLREFLAQIKCNCCPDHPQTFSKSQKQKINNNCYKHRRRNNRKGNLTSLGSVSEKDAYGVLLTKLYKRGILADSSRYQPPFPSPPLRPTCSQNGT